jgi:hypothetical protein
MKPNAKRKLRRIGRFLYTHALPLVLSLWALYLSRQANLIVHQQTSDFRAVEKLDLAPDLRLATWLGSEDIPDIPRHLTLYNAGPLDAINVRVELRLYFYLESTKQVKGLINDSSWNFQAPKLEVHNQVSFPFPSGFWSQIQEARSSQRNIFGVRIIYHHPTSLATTVSEAFYFLDPNGRWVQENDSSLKPDLYDDLREAVLKRAQEQTEDLSSAGFSDRLHDLRSK